MSQPESSKKGLKGFFQSLFQKLDKKMEEKAKDKKCCGGNDGKSEPNSCCK